MLYDIVAPSFSDDKAAPHSQNYRKRRIHLVYQKNLYIADEIRLLIETVENQRLQLQELKLKGGAE